MRRGNTHYFIFPEYFDKSLTRRKGRRLPLSEALENPTFHEIRLAAEKLGYNYERRDDAAYPRQWWERKGLILIEKRNSKLITLRELSNEIKTFIRPRLEKQKKELAKEVMKRKITKAARKPVDTKKKPHEFRPKRRR